MALGPRSSKSWSSKSWSSKSSRHQVLADMFRNIFRGVRFASEITNRDVSRAFNRELHEIKFRSSLMNQTSWKTLASLEDINPMMETFKKLSAVNGALTPVAVLHTVTALSRSAKESPLLFRSAMESVRSQYQSQLYLDLAAHCDAVAESIIANKIPYTNKIIGTLLGIYEIVDPAKGAAFYVEGNFTSVGGSVIPCMVKSNAPLSLVEQAYRDTTRKSARVTANMAWAYLKYHQWDKAVELRSQIQDAPLSTEKFLVSAFVGDAPVDMALQEFASTTIAPHQAAVVRLVNNVWATNRDPQQQLEIFRKFLELSRGFPESAFKPVTYAITRNILNQNKDLDQLVEDVKGLTNVYSSYPSKSIFLNILLTHVSKHRGREAKLIMPILQAYGADTLSPITYRVRLNSLARITPENKHEYIRKLWNTRCQLADPIDTYDWQALSKADPALAKTIYEETGAKDREVERILN